VNAAAKKRKNINALIANINAGKLNANNKRSFNNKKLTNNERYVDPYKVLVNAAVTKRKQEIANGLLAVHTEG
jgi:hypothetical protein